MSGYVEFDEMLKRYSKQQRHWLYALVNGGRATGTRTTASFQVHFIDMLSKPGLPGGNDPWYLVPLEQKFALVHRIRQPFVCSAKNILITRL